MSNELIKKEMFKKLRPFASLKHTKVLLYIFEQEDDLTARKIAEGVDLPIGSVRPYLSTLKSLDAIERIKKKGNSEPCYKLKDETETILERVYDIVLKNIKKKAKEYKDLFED